MTCSIKRLNIFIDLQGRGLVKGLDTKLTNPSPKSFNGLEMIAFCITVTRDTSRSSTTTPVVSFFSRNLLSSPAERF